MISSWYGHEGCVRLLLEAKASVNDTNVSLEHALPQYIAMDQLTRIHPLAPHQQNYDGWTALHCAAAHGHLAIAKRLLEGGADWTLKNKYGRTALDYARSRGKSEVVALLSEPRYAALMDTDRCA
jgi:ankyrin repeat protein